MCAGFSYAFVSAYIAFLRINATAHIGVDLWCTRHEYPKP